MEFSPVNSSANLIGKYSKLFGLCFPKASHLSTAAEAQKYLFWLYRDNPEGEVVGFDAWENKTLTAHYSTIPVSWSFSGTLYKGLLSLNTATHPEFRGKGLFTQLAEKTYQAAREQGYDFVIGVANSNSTPGFIRKLGFSLISPLQARVGIGALPIKTRQHLNNSPKLIKHNWTEKSFVWRLSNPHNPGHIIKQDMPLVQIEADTDKPLFKAYAEVACDQSFKSESSLGLHPRIMLGILPEGVSWGSYFSLPGRLKPSPLNLIFLALQGNNLMIDKKHLYFNFLDFDAY